MEKKERILLCFSGVFTVLTLGLTYIVLNYDLIAFDGAIYKWFNSWWREGFTPIVRAFTLLADSKVCFVLTGLAISFLAYKKLYYYAFLLTTSAGGGVAIAYAMKLTIARERPGELLYMNIWGLFSDQVSYSFPSGHALKAMLLFGVLIYTIYHEMKSRKLKGFLITFLVIAISLVGVGQVIRERHFASDIIGGYFAAVAWLTFCMAVNRKVLNYIWVKLPHRTRERLEQSLG